MMGQRISSIERRFAGAGLRHAEIRVARAANPSLLAAAASRSDEVRSALLATM